MKFVDTPWHSWELYVSITPSTGAISAGCYYCTFVINMASEHEKEKSVSFTFSKKKTATKLVRTNKEYEHDEHESSDWKDFIHSAEGKLLKSLKPKESVKELVIPCLPRNDLLFQHGIKGDKTSTLDRQAAKEIISDLSKSQPSDETGTNFAIPLLAKTNLVTTDGSADTISEESTLQDYDAVPVVQFGAAMLRGMGWKKGEGLGGTNKGFVVPIEFIPRSQGLGLGAERKHEENVKKKRRKPGDAESSGNSGPIIEKDGKVRHFKSLDEKIPDKQIQATTFSKGSYVIVISGSHRDLTGKITAMDEDNARAFVRLAINSEEVTLSQHNLRIIDRDEYKQFSKGQPSQHNERDHRTTKRKKEDEEHSENSPTYSPNKQKSKHKKDSRDKASTMGISRDRNEHGESTKESVKDDEKHEACWMAPLIRVRIISKSFKKGNYYHKKVIIQDVVSTALCACKTDEGLLLEDVPQNILETVIPKNKHRFVLFVQGKYKGLIGEIVQTESSKQQAIIQMLRDKSVVKTHYDDISEFVGDVHGE